MSSGSNAPSTNPPSDNVNSGGNNEPLLLEAVRKMMHDMQAENLQQINNLINERLGPLSSDRTWRPSMDTGISSRLGTPSINMPPQRSNENIYNHYQAFSNCRPKEYAGSKDPKETMCWIREMERTLRISNTPEDLQIEFAARMFTGDALSWWDTICDVVGMDRIASWTWEEFIDRVKAKFCSMNVMDRMTETFYELRKGSMTVDQYSKKFTDILRFVGERIPDERDRINRYVRGLPADYDMEVRRATTLDQAIDISLHLEHVLERRQEERRQMFSEKRKRESVGGSSRTSQSGSNKRSNSGNSKEPCHRCGNFHSGECRYKNSKCTSCGKIGHRAQVCHSDVKETKSKTSRDVTCFKCGEKGHYSNNCPQNQENTMASTANRNESTPKVKARSFQLTEDEAKEAHDVVVGTILLNSSPVRVLIDSGADFSFISHACCSKLSLPSVQLSENYLIETANDGVASVSSRCEDCTVGIDGFTFKISLLPIAIRSFDLIIGMDWLRANHAKNRL